MPRCELSEAPKKLLQSRIKVFSPDEVKNLFSILDKTPAGTPIEMTTVLNSGTTVMWKESPPPVKSVDAEGFGQSRTTKWRLQKARSAVNIEALLRKTMSISEHYPKHIDPRPKFHRACKFKYSSQNNTERAFEVAKQKKLKQRAPTKSKKKRGRPPKSLCALKTGFKGKRKKGMDKGRNFANKTQRAGSEIFAQVDHKRKGWNPPLTTVAVRLYDAKRYLKSKDISGGHNRKTKTLQKVIQILIKMVTLGEVLQWQKDRVNMHKNIQYDKVKESPESSNEYRELIANRLQRRKAHALLKADAVRTKCKHRGCSKRVDSAVDVCW